MSKRTAVIGASPNPERYAYITTLRLQKYGFEAVPVGIRTGKIGNTEILVNYPPLENIDTVTLYVGPQNQVPWIDYIFSLNPKRIIFNPGTENEAFIQKAEEKGIECVIACTLVMLSVGDY
jgi:uncharacterized protein